jgi:hypothetical protein
MSTRANSGITTFGWNGSIHDQHVIEHYLEVPLLDSQKKELNLHALLLT